MNSYAISSVIILAVMYVFAIVTSAWTMISNSKERNSLWKFSIAAVVLLTALYVTTTITISYIWEKTTRKKIIVRDMNNRFYSHYH